MLKITVKFLFLALVVVGLSGSSFAQMQIPTDIQQDIENRLAAAQNTIVSDAGGRVLQISIQPTSSSITEVLQLGYNINGQLSTVTDPRGLTVTIQRDGAGAITGFIFPDGGTVDITAKGCIAVDTFNITQQNKTIDSLLYSDGFQSYRPRPRGGNACRDAAWAIGLGIAVCAASGPLSVPCFAATANAAYHVARCYEEGQN